MLRPLFWNCYLHNCCQYTRTVQTLSNLCLYSYGWIWYTLFKLDFCYLYYSRFAFPLVRFVFLTHRFMSSFIPCYLLSCKLEEIKIYILPLRGFALNKFNAFFYVGPFHRSTLALLFFEWMKINRLDVRGNYGECVWEISTFTPICNCEALL